MSYKPYYQSKSNIEICIIVTVSNHKYTFDCLERATHFIQQILEHSVDAPVVTLSLYMWEADE